MRPEQLEALGLGLEKAVVRLEPADPAWALAADQVAHELLGLLGDHVDAVEPIGSAVVPALLAKPIVDFAAQLRRRTDPAPAIALLQERGWEFLGDAGDGGGLVLVLSVRSDHRVAHLHLIAYGDPQWDDYLRLRERLRRDPDAQVAYAEVKRRLAQDHPNDRHAYADGKDEIVRRLRSSG